MAIKRIIAVLLASSMLMVCASCTTDSKETSATTTTVEETSISETSTEETTSESTEGSYVIRENALPEAYMAIINHTNDLIDQVALGEYEAAMDEDGYLGIAEEAIAIGADAAAENIGFALVDINEDGIDELVIASKVNNDGVTEYVGPAFRAGYSVLAVYTLDGDEAVLIVEAWARNTWYINADGKFINEGSSGAAYHEIDLCTLGEGATKLNIEYRLYSDYDMESETISLYEEVNGTISVVDAEEIWDVFDNTTEQFTTEMLQLELVPINSALV